MPDDQLTRDRLSRALTEKLENTESKIKEFSIYWGKKNSQVAAAILKEFANDGDVILDPFIGSGSTLYGAVESQINLKFIGIDVNELPLSQINFNMLKINTHAVSLGGESLNQLIEKFKSHYQYLVHGEIYEISKTILNIDNHNLLPIKFWVRTSGEKRTFAVEQGSKTFEELKEQYVRRQRDRNFPKDFELPQNSRIAVKAGMKISDLYSSINFKVLLAMRDSLDSDIYLRGLLSSVLHLVKFTDLGSQSQFPYWYPKTNAVDRNLLDLLTDKHKQIFNSIKKLNKGASAPELPVKVNYLLKNIPIQNYVAPSEFGLADLVITDPPYFDQVAYSEYLTVWEFFTGLKVDLENEIVESNRLGSGKTREAYIRDMELAFRTIRRNVKPSALMFMYYKDSRLSNINDILSILKKSGWRFTGQCHVSKNQFSYKQNTSKDSTVAGDCLMIFSADEPSFDIPTIKGFDGKPSEIVIKIVKEYLHQHGASTISKIYDETLVHELYNLGLLAEFPDPKSLFSLLQSSFEYNKETRKIHVGK